MKKFVFWGALLTLCIWGNIAHASAATWYVEPGATGSGTSTSDPGDLDTIATSYSANGDHVLLSPGTYALNRVLDIQNDIQIIGQNPSTTYIDCSSLPVPSNQCIVFGNPTTPLTQNTGIKNVSMIQSGLPMASSAIKLQYDSSIIIQNIYVNDSFMNGIVLDSTNDSGLPWVKNSVFQSWNYGIYGDKGGGIEKIIDCEFKKQLVAGIHLYDTPAVREIRGNEFLSTSTGIEIEIDQGLNNVGAIIIENDFVNNTTGIETINDHIESTSNHQITQNTFNNNDFSIILEGDSEMSEVSANQFYFANFGISNQGGNHIIANNLFLAGATSTAGIDSETGNNTIAYNTIIGFDYAGINLTNSDQSLITNNIINDCEMYGIYVDSTSTTAALGSNNAYGTSVSGFELYGPFIDLGRNTSVNPQFKSTTDFHLQSTSPLIDAANPFLFLIYRDIEGNLRDLANPDMGCYEA